MIIGLDTFSILFIFPPDSSCGIYKWARWKGERKFYPYLMRMRGFSVLGRQVDGDGLNFHLKELLLNTSSLSLCKHPWNSSTYLLMSLVNSSLSLTSPLKRKTNSINNELSTYAKPEMWSDPYLIVHHQLDDGYSSSGLVNRVPCYGGSKKPAQPNPSPTESSVKPRWRFINWAVGKGFDGNWFRHALQNG